MRGLILTVFAVLAVCLFPSTVAAVPDFDATLSKAERQIDGTITLEGSITWRGCPDACNWLPFVVLQPSLPSYECKDGELFESDPNIRSLWSGNRTQTANGTVTIQVSGLIDPSPFITDLRACIQVMTTTNYPSSWTHGGVYVTKALPVAAAPPPAPVESVSEKRAKAIAKCRKKYRKAKHRKKRAACIKKAKRRFR